MSGFAAPKTLGLRFASQVKTHLYGGKVGFKFKGLLIQ